MRKRLWFWSGVILLSIVAFFWFGLIVSGTAEPRPLNEVVGVTIIGLLITSLPTGLGIYCVRRGRKSPVAVVPPVPVPPVSPRRSTDDLAVVVPHHRLTREELELQGKICPNCDTATDLAQCPMCHLWFCRTHDRHECFPTRGSQLQKQIDVIRKRRRWAGTAMYIGLATAGFGALGLLESHENWGILWGFGFYFQLLLISVFAGLVTLGVLGIIACLHYDKRLRQLGGRMRSIRPQTAKRDGDKAKKRKPLIR